MTDNAADIADTYEMKAGKRDRIHLFGTFTLGSSGAIASEDVDDPKMDATKESGTGSYSLVLPAVPTRGILKVWVQASATLFSVQITAFSPTLGTAAFLTNDAAGAAANGASGNVIAYELIVDTEK